MELIFPHSPQKEPPLSTPQSQVFRLQNCETIHFSCHPVLGTFYGSPRKQMPPKTNTPTILFVIP